MVAPNRTFPVVVSLLFLTLFIFVPSAHAFIEQQLDVGLRAGGMGGAWLAAGNEVAVLQGNPSLLRVADRPLLSMALDDVWYRQEAEMGARNAYTSSRLPRNGGGLFPFHKDEIGWAVGFSWERFSYWSSPLYDDVLFEEYPYWLNGGLAVEFTPGIMIGLSIQVLSGEYKATYHEITPEYPYGTGHTIERQEKFTGIAQRYGFSVDGQKLGWRFPVRLGAMIRPGYTYSISADGRSREYEQPFILGAGVSWMPYSSFTLALDVERHLLSGLVARYEMMDNFHATMPLTEHDNDMTALRVGAEYEFHPFGLDVIPRVGFNMLPTYCENNPTAGSDTNQLFGDAVYAYGQTYGLGIGYAGVRLDVAYQYAAWEYESLFMVSPSSLNDKIREAQRQWLVGVSYRF